MNTISKYWNDGTRIFYSLERTKDRHYALIRRTARYFSFNEKTNKWEAFYRSKGKYFRDIIELKYRARGGYPISLSIATRRKLRGVIGCYLSMLGCKEIDE